MAAYLMDSFSVSTTRACRVVSLPKSMYYYQSLKDDQPVIDKLNELVSMKVNHRAGLDAYLFEDLYEFHQIKEEWMEDYNHHRPHESLDNLSPIKFCNA
ncbi:MAG: integrase core domain-containing protein [Bacteroidota bacterium]